LPQACAGVSLQSAAFLPASVPGRYAYLWPVAARITPRAEPSALAWVIMRWPATKYSFALFQIANVNSLSYQQIIHAYVWSVGSPDSARSRAMDAFCCAMGVREALVSTINVFHRVIRQRENMKERNMMKFFEFRRNQESIMLKVF
jgi:hypothetical protein